jgi:hypothetical protein
MPGLFCFNQESANMDECQNMALISIIMDIGKAMDSAFGVKMTESDGLRVQEDLFQIFGDRIEATGKDN